MGFLGLGFEVAAAARRDERDESEIFEGNLK
jgi:hypothetical protein